jgi:phosphinothricin acetyltransferase
MEPSIRFARDDDLPAIIEIFNQAIQTHMSTGYLRTVTVDERTDWFHEHRKETYPILVADYEGTIVGWISIDPYRKGRDAFVKTVEACLFIHNEYKRRGIGNQLLHAMMRTAKHLGYTTLFTIVLENNKGSMALLEKNHFERWGFLPGVAEIDGKQIGHVYYGKKL